MIEQPHRSDAILSNQALPSDTEVVLGGLAGVRQRLENEAVAVRLSALKDTIHYGEEGIELVASKLEDPAEQVQRLARRILRGQGQERGRQILLNRNPLDYFTTLDDWRHENYNSQVGITDPENNAYAVRMLSSTRISHTDRSEIYDLSQFNELLTDPRLSGLQALIFLMENRYRDDTFDVALEAICEAKKLLPNLKALYVGDSGGEVPKYRKSQIPVLDIRPFLEAFPELELLQVYGHFGRYRIKGKGLRHENLRTLIIETAHLHEHNIQQLCEIELPSLEYFELWLGHWHEISDGKALKALNPILTNMGYPNLKYLGLCCTEETDILLEKLLQPSVAPILGQLAVLDLKMGTMTGKHVKKILSTPEIRNLKLLNVSGNDLAPMSVTLLKQLPFAVEASDQNRQQKYRYLALHE